MSAFHDAIVERFIADLEECALPKIIKLRDFYGWTDAETEAVTMLVWLVTQETAKGMAALYDETTTDTIRRFEKYT